MAIPAYIWDLFTGIYIIRYVLSKPSYSLCANYELQVQADYELTAQVFSYRNPSHRGLSIPDGQCCDGACTNDCDNRLTFCLRPQGTTDPDLTQCSVDEPLYTTTTTGTDDQVFLNDNLLGLPNPLIFTGDTWPVSCLTGIFWHYSP